MHVTTASVVSSELAEMCHDARSAAATKRGGAALLATIDTGLEPDESLSFLVASGCVRALVESGELRAFAVVRAGVIEAVYVAPHERRHKLATTLVRALIDEDHPVDAFALPGDRGMKSLYESIGWKARLLTMRAG